MFVVVLNWNGVGDTIECVNSLYNSDYLNYEIVIVDNGSTDDSVVRLRDNFKEIKIIENAYNKGFAEGNNIGIEYSIKNGADYVLILNNDTVVAKNALSVMVNLAENTGNLGVLGAKILFYNNPGVIQSCGVKFLYDDPRLGEIINEGKINDKEYSNGFIQVDHLIGCAILLKRSTIELVGGFDERFFAYWEDTDLCLRASEQGLLNICALEAEVWHKISSSTDGGSHPSIYYFMSRNRVLFIRKHNIFDGKIVPKIFWKDFKNIALSGYYLKITAILAMMNGYYDAYVGNYGSLPKWISSPKSDFIEMKLRMKLRDIKKLVVSYKRLLKWQ